MIEVEVLLDKTPLPYTFVSHRPDFGDPVVAMTDRRGVARFDDVAASASIDIVVHAHNLAVRMLDGTNPGVSEVALRFRNKSNGSRLNISPANKKQFHHYVIMNRCYEVYETVFAPIAPFNGPSRRTFPFGGSDKAAHDHRREPAVDCRFPETLVPGKLPWVQPQSLTGGVPLMHLKSPTQDRRLLGSKTVPATTVAHEFAHALHFSLLSVRKRWELAAKYALWIGKELANGRSGTHRTDKRTSPLIAFIESIGIFSQRFWVYAHQVEPDLTGKELRASFVADELAESPRLADILPGYAPIATRQPNGRINPHLTGASTEGSVYGAIFLDFASRTNLATAINLYLRCDGFTPTAWLAYASTTRKGRFADDAAAVRRTWKL